MADAYAAYMGATQMKDRSRDRAHALWREIEPEIGHLYIEDVDTLALDTFKQKLRAKPRPNGSHVEKIGANTMNHYLQLARATLRFMWKRGKLKSVPYVPMESVPTNVADWYSADERDTFLDGVFRAEPEWYCFFFLTMRLGLRRGEVYGLAHHQIRREPPMVTIDQSVQRGTKKRAALITTRKNGYDGMPRRRSRRRRACRLHAGVVARVEQPPPSSLLPTHRPDSFSPR
jgi:hypothetical protein